jgi:hypothetical protein
MSQIFKGDLMYKKLGVMVLTMTLLLSIIGCGGVKTPKEAAPEFTSPAAISVSEGIKEIVTVTVVHKTAVDFSIVGGADAVFFMINPQTGVLSFKTVVDFENPADADGNNIYEVIVQAADIDKNSNILLMRITVTDDSHFERKIFKTGQDDGPHPGLAFGYARDFTVKTEDDQRVIVAGDRMWEDSPHTIEKRFGFYDAQLYCKALNYAGYDDWRVPSRHELAEMLNYGKIGTGNMFDDIFRYRTGGNYWTHQEKLSSRGDSDRAWSISFNDGGVYDRYKESACYVRCIRGRYLSDHSDFSQDGDVIVDNKTGIMWQNADFIGGKTWKEAKEHCKNLHFQGYDDWRLPNVNELRSIMAYDDNEVLFEHLSPIEEPDLDSGHSWSSTEANATHAYYNLNDWDQATNRDSLIIMYKEHPKSDAVQMMLNRCIRGGHL